MPTAPAPARSRWRSRGPMHPGEVASPSRIPHPVAAAAASPRRSGARPGEARPPSGQPAPSCARPRLPTAARPGAWPPGRGSCPSPEPATARPRHPRTRSEPWPHRRHATAAGPDAPSPIAEPWAHDNRAAGPQGDLAALGGGRPAEVLGHLRRIHDPADPAYHLAVRCFMIGDLADVARRSGDPEGIRIFVDEMETAAGQIPSPSLHAGLRHARALLAKDADAGPLFYTALQSDMSTWPFLRAKVQLSYGEWLHQQRHDAASR